MKSRNNVVWTSLNSSSGVQHEIKMVKDEVGRHLAQSNMAVPFGQPRLPGSCPLACPLCLAVTPVDAQHTVNSLLRMAQNTNQLDATCETAARDFQVMTSCSTRLQSIYGSHVVASTYGSHAVASAIMVCIATPRIAEGLERNHCHRPTLPCEAATSGTAIGT